MFAATFELEEAAGVFAAAVAADAGAETAAVDAIAGVVAGVAAGDALPAGVAEAVWVAPDLLRKVCRVSLNLVRAPFFFSFFLPG